METIHIPHLKFPASRICLGTWAIGGWLWGGSDEQESLKTVLAALESGINMIDTAPVYGFGVSEEIVGKALQKHGHRDRIIIATKAGLEWNGDKVFCNSSPERIENEIEDSLKRLQTDYIDLYQIHWPDPITPIEKTAEAMLKLLNKGKIRAIGVSNFTPEQMKKFLTVAPIHTSQPPYNLFERAIEKDIFPFTEKAGIITLAYGSLCRGLLGGKIKTDTKYKGDDIRKSDPKFQMPLLQQYLDAVSALDEFAKKNYGKNVLALAIRWVLDQGKTIALWGARQPSQLKGLEDSMGWSLDTDAKRRIDEILKENISTPVGLGFSSPPSRDK
jgi:aryl-alcohol dehydrogenase-like predicted oxidoreductase